jgi:CHAT domain-containing protein/tetratricopeptide (TPR) repeat protein
MAPERGFEDPVASAVRAWLNSREIADLREVIETRWADLNTAAADQLLGELLQHYAGRPDFVDPLRNRRHLLYRCRNEGIHAAFSSEGQRFDPHIYKTVYEFLFCGWDEAREFFVKNRAALLGSEAQRVLTYLERYFQDDPKVVGAVRERRDRIRAAIDRGVDKAYPVFANLEAVKGAWVRLMEARDWPGKLEVIRTDAAVLLSDEADRYVEAWLSAKWNSASPLYQAFAFHRGILARVRRDGIDSICFDSGLARSSVDDPLSSAEHEQAEELLSLISTRHGAHTAISENDIVKLLKERPDLSKAWERLPPWVIFIDPDDADRLELRRLLQQLAQFSGLNYLEQRVHLLRRGLEIPLVQQSPGMRAAFHGDLGVTLSGCPGPDRAALLEEALTHVTLAETVWTKENYPVEWAQNRWFMGKILTYRTVGGREKNIEQGLDCFDATLEILDARDSAQGRVTRYVTLGHAYSVRVAGSVRENVEEALKYLRLALDDEAFRYLSPCDQGDAWSSFGITITQRIAGERADNIEQAIYGLQQARQCFVDAEAPDRVGVTDYALATAFARREYGDSAENRREAVNRLDACLRVCTKEQWPESWAGALMVRANILRHEASSREEFERVLEDFRMAQTVLTRATSPDEWAAIEHNRGCALLAWAQVSGEQVHIDAAIQHVRSALEILERCGNGLRWSQLHVELGTLHTLLAKHGVADAVARAEAHFRLSLEERPSDSFPVEHSESQAALAGLLLATGRWAEAHDALSEGIQAGILGFETAYTEAGRHIAIAWVSRLFAEDAYALVRLHRYGEALLRLDGGKTRILAQSLALNAADLAGLDVAERSDLQETRSLVQELEVKMRAGEFAPTCPVDRDLAAALKDARGRLSNVLSRVRAKHPEFMASTLTLPDLLALAPPGGALVAPIVAIQGTAIFVIPHGTTEVTERHVVRVNSFTLPNLGELVQGPCKDRVVGGWFKAYDEQIQHRQAWLDAIDHIGHELWNAFMGVVHAALEAFGVGEGAPVILMPQGGLGLLPMHAAWREVAGRKRYLAEDYTVSHAPSGYALEVSLRRVEVTSPVRALLAINPTCDLVYAQAEGDALEALLGAACQPLRQAAATLSAIREAAPNHTHLHFCCHGFNNWSDPMKSGLVLAGGQKLTLAEVLGTFDLSRARLVTLSACETGLTDIHRMPDEHVGLPAGFLQAGAAAVISALWRVDDLATMLLMERFYRLHISEDETPATALRNAQRWLRDVTNRELAQYLQIFQSARSDGPHQSYKMAWDRFAEHARTEPARRPFEHPYYWGAFVLHGV